MLTAIIYVCADTAVPSKTVDIAAAIETNLFIISPPFCFFVIINKFMFLCYIYSINGVPHLNYFVFVFYFFTESHASIIDLSLSVFPADA